MDCINRLTVRMIIGLVLSLFLHLSVRAEVMADCFEIVPGSLSHIRMVNNHGVDFAIDSYGEKGWRVTVHYTRGSGYVENATLGQKINNRTFTQDRTTVEGIGNEFCFAFRWWHKFDTLPSGTATLHYYGWVILGTENGQLVIKACERSDLENEVTVGGTDLNPSGLAFLTIDHGDWVELDSSCVPRDTQGSVVIPKRIGGKPVRAIAYKAFTACSSITEIVIPDGVLSIGDAAFQYCTKLEKLEIPSSVTNVGAYVINECERLGELTINAALPTFGYKAFAHSGITNLVLASGITNINNYAFADSKNLKSVSIPQSVRRICKWSFDENCTSLRSVSVPYATVIEDEAFPPGCVITRYGPIIDAKGAGNKDIDEETKIALMRTLDLKDYESATCLIFVEAPPGDGDDQPVTTPVACAHLGISPYAVETWNDGGLRGVQYKMPTVEFVGIDSVARTITGRVVPAECTRIVSIPLKRVFGFYRIYWDEYDCQFHKGTDWGEWIYDGVKGFSVDVSNYVSSNGLFKIVFGDDVLMEKYPQPSHLFRIELRDRAHELW